MRISVFGLGYVGAVAAVCLAREGHQVVGVDPNETKVDLINGERSPIIEKSVPELTEEAVRDGRLSATTDAAAAVNASDVSLICVGTPSENNGSLNLRYVQAVCRDIGEALCRKDGYHAVVIRSTILPGTMRDVVIPTLEAASNKTAGEEFGVCHNPEFLREGSAVHDYYHPPKTVIGELDQRSGDAIAALYESLDAPLFRVPLEVAEMVKYSDNVWHAVKVCFANEIGNVCKALDIDSHRVMDIFCQDTKLNLSPYYLKPGFAFGGSCLPKDVRALSYRARSLDLNLPLMFSVLPSNQQQIDRVVQMILENGCKKVGVLGFSFKAGTDDLRESPIVTVIETLLGKGFDIRIYDHNVSLARLVGSNRDFILNQIPHISNMMVESVDEVLDHAGLLVIGNRAEQFADIMEKVPPNVRVLDLVRIAESPGAWANYSGVCW